MNNRRMTTSSMIFLGLCACILTGCGTLSRLSEVGRDPQLTPTEDPTKDPKWRPLSMPVPSRQPALNEANALWRSGSRAFFKDQRAAQVGDIITVLVNMTDTATMSNVSSANRTGAEGMGVPNLFGFETEIPHILAGANPSSLVSI